MAAAPPLPAPPKPGPVAVPALHAKLGKGPGKLGVLAFTVVLIIGVIYAGSHLLAVCRLALADHHCGGKRIDDRKQRT